MKIIPRSSIAVLMILLFGHGVVSRSINIIDDVRIETKEDGTLDCDSLICPQEATSCQVTKRNDPNDFSQLVRNRKCFSSNGEIIDQKKTYEPNKFQGNVSINIVSGRGGTSTFNRPLTAEEQRELENNLSRAQQTIDDALKPFRDGTFARNLQKQISESLKNAFNF